MAATWTIDSGRRFGSRCKHAEMAAANAAGTSGACRRTSQISAACAARSFAKLLPPASGGRPQSKCHHTQPQA
jgi:hypothetical protein